MFSLDIFLKTSTTIIWVHRKMVWLPFWMKEIPTYISTEPLILVQTYFARQKIQITRECSKWKWDIETHRFAVANWRFLSCSVWWRLSSCGAGTTGRWGRICMVLFKMVLQQLRVGKGFHTYWTQKTLQMKILYCQLWYLSISVRKCRVTEINYANTVPDHNSDYIDLYLSRKHRYRMGNLHGLPTGRTFN